MKAAVEPDVTIDRAVVDRAVVDRRAVLRGTAATAAAVAASAAWPVAVASSVSDALGASGPPSAAALSDAAAFDANVARMPWLAPFKGVVDGGPNRGDLACAALTVTGRWPAELRGRFYRNGPALFERAGQRYHHWFDGDGMVQQFRFDGHGVSHRGRLVRTAKLEHERAAGQFLYPAFGTTIRSEAETHGPDAMNTANTNAVEHAGRVLAMWEGGSAYALDPSDLSTRGPLTWQAGLEQVPFSAHPKIDAAGHLWNIGSFAETLVVWHVDPAGTLARVQTTASPYPHGLAHDVAVSERYLVLPLPPVKMHYDAVAQGARPEQAFVFDRAEPLRILVMKKDDIAEQRIFELPAQMVFHVGNAYERPDGSIAFSFVGAENTEFLVHGAVALSEGRVLGSTGAALQNAVLDMASGRARVEALPGVIEFPRIDPRRIGRPARYVAGAASWKSYPDRRNTLFHGVQLTDLQSGRAERYDYGERMVVEEHLVVPKPRSSHELDAWLVGTTFDAQRRVTLVNVIDARHVGAGPIAQAALPYWLPLGFHGSFTAA